MSDIGKCLGPYTLLGELGRGGQSAVYLAREQGLDRPVALKVLLGGAVTGWRTRARFQREAETIARLNHSNICTLYGTGSAEGFLFIAMEYVEGETLARLIDEARRTGAKPPLNLVEHLKAVEGTESHRHASNDEKLRALLHYMEKAARALHGAHEAGVIHRDVKPANLMVTPAGEPKLLDFGLAQDEESASNALSLTGQPLGTPAYMPPEQIEPSEERLDGRSDIYALGAVFYECLTLTRPHWGSSRDSIYRSILTRAPPDINQALPGAPSDLGVVVNTALARDRNRRYQNALEFAEDLRRLRCYEPILAKRTTSLQRLRLWSRRNPALAATGAAIFAVLITGLLLTTGLLLLTKKAIQENRRFTDLRMLPYLEQVENETLWPTRPEKVPEMKAWLLQAESLLSRAGEHAARLDLLQKETMSGAGREKKREHDQIAAFLQNLEKLRELVSAVKQRRIEAEVLERKTYDLYGPAWREAIAMIVDERECPAYGGLRLGVQFGLAPIGRDPESGLFEFADLQTGTVPCRDPGTGKIVLEEETGLVFVLVPGGCFRMGAIPPSDEMPMGTPNVDPWAEAQEGPVHTVRLDPFFISKYEMTRHQWQTALAKETSDFREDEGSMPSDVDKPLNGLHPLMGIHGERVRSVLRHLGLTLPTEAQWEYAARAGTATVWWTGDVEASLEGTGNFKDQAWKTDYHPPVTVSLTGLPWNDGYPNTSPIGVFKANGFGLYDVLGNVIELVRDRYGSYDAPLRPGDGERIVMGGRFSLARGGDRSSPVTGCRIANRCCTVESYPNLGYRPAREIEE